MVVVVIDQAAKAAVLRALAMDGSVAVIPGVLNLTLVRNTGIAFGLLPGFPGALAALLALTVLFLFFYNSAPRRETVRGGDMWQRDGAGRTGAGLMLGGAAGNLIDRARLGYVVDFLDLRVWPVFNLADAAVVCGGALLLLAFLRHKRGEG